MDQTTRGCYITKWAWRTIQSKVLPTKGYHKWGIIHKGRSVGGHEIYAPSLLPPPGTFLVTLVQLLC